MKILKENTLADLKAAYARPQMDNDQLNPIIDGIFKEVQEKGDEDIRKYTH